ncbi:MAG: hypothetical protein M3Z66_03130, partial [Chloroflexota bacterium]|nr:hypothetical protein [Chloroflexota bacterium]
HGHYGSSISDGECLRYPSTGVVVAVALPGQPSLSGGGAAVGYGIYLGKAIACSNGIDRRASGRHAGMNGP